MNAALPVVLILTTMLDFGDYRAERFSSRDGGDIVFHLFGHASVAVEYDGHTVYIDPVGAEADYRKLPKADVILVTHAHSDHFDPKAVEALRQPSTVVIANHIVAAACRGAVEMLNGDQLSPAEWLKVEAVEAYNMVRTQYHPRGRDNGYLLTIGGERILVAGDTEATPELLAQRNIDYLFLPVNLPYTMSVDEAVRAALTISPRVLFPYHTLGTDRSEIEKMPLSLPEIETVVWKDEK